MCVVGFYVTLVVSRWWGQFESVPWPDRLGALVGGHVRGGDETARLIRRTLMRYANLSGVLIYRSISTAVYKRFPTMEHLVQAGLMTAEEWRQLEALPSPHSKFWVPCTWFVNLTMKARTEGRINNDVALTAILNVVDEMYDSVPLMERDKYWNESEPQPPYTTASAEHRKPSFMGSALDISVPKEEMEFQSNLEQIKEHEEANHSTPLLGGLSRFLGIQSPSFPRSSTSSRVSLLRRRPGAPLGRSPLYLHPDGPPTPSQNHHPQPPERDLDFAFSMPMYERPGFYSCPQTPIHCMPPAPPRPRPPRRPQGDWDSGSVAPPVLGSQFLPPDTPGRIPAPPSSAFPWLCEEGEPPSGPAFFSPTPPGALSLPKLRPTQGLLSRRPPPPCLSLDIPSSADNQPGPPSALGVGGGGDKVFSFTPPSRTPVLNSSSNSINAANSNSTATNLCNGGSHGNFCNHGNFSTTNRASISGPNSTLSTNATSVSSASSVSTQPATNQQHSPNDSGISLAEGDLLGSLMVEGGRVKAPAAREQD
ncbi:hypothetical protein MATL_G00101540 [Megalops atlanticus]|uniref:Bestrophin homolog n=1 Tax=Megalops atlanticus TaxID=7932 RepID=A0A9D3Q1V8_MEGAT|nr:hypothetical protein MATL_G00101540 [Megalops atlanticus]